MLITATLTATLTATPTLAATRILYPSRDLPVRLPVAHPIPSRTCIPTPIRPPTPPAPPLEVPPGTSALGFHMYAAGGRAVTLNGMRVADDGYAELQLAEGSTVVTIVVTDDEWQRQVP